MKKKISAFFLFFVLVLDVYSQSEQDQYGNGNGTIIEMKISNNINWIRRQHNQRIQIGDLARPERLMAYTDPTLENSQELFRLNYNDYINITEVVTGADITTDRRDIIWVKISTDQGSIGWLNIGGSDPYSNNRWVILERIISGNRTWTVRRQESRLAIWETLEVRDKPGLYGSTVIFNLIPLLPEDNDGWTFFVDGFAITEETDVVDGIDWPDHWVKIEDKDGRIGWIFGGHGTIERGGPAFFTPENIIYVRLGYY